MSEGRHALAAGRLFDGARLHADAAVVIEGDRIAAVVPRRDLQPGVTLRDMGDAAWLAPGFIDVQVNGGGDVLFNDTPTPDGIAAILAAHRRFGTTALLPTLVSDTQDKMRAAIAAVSAVMAREPGVLGIHLEGPFLNPEKAGVHNRAVLRAPEDDALEMLTAPHGGVTLVTLAPERVPEGFIRALARAGVKVSLGHSLASYAQTRAAMAEGLMGFTHLFNAMRPITAREPGPIGAALETVSAFYGLIVDGEHVAPASLKMALRGAGTPMLVTDAMPCVGGSRSIFKLYGEDISVRDGRATRADGTLAGSAIDMASAVRNSVRLLGVSLERALQMASAAPAEFLGLGDRLGRLAPGCRADIIALDPVDVRIHASWVAGKQSG